MERVDAVVFVDELAEKPTSSGVRHGLILRVARVALRGFAYYAHASI